jgi:hypothetical protein
MFAKRAIKAPFIAQHKRVLRRRNRLHCGSTAKELTRLLVGVERSGRDACAIEQRSGG